MNKNITPVRAWMDPERNGPPKMQQGKEERSIICHTGCEQGSVEQARLIYRENKALKDSDNHTKMN